jgi:hypothetical protein
MSKSCQKVVKYVKKLPQSCKKWSKACQTKCPQVVKVGLVETIKKKVPWCNNRKSAMMQ